MSASVSGRQAAIYGCEGLALTDGERAFFKQADPWGFIVFARNIESPEQLRALTAEMRETVGWQAPILIDQEGGRVARLRPPNWRAYPPGRRYGEIYDANPEKGELAAFLGARLIAQELMELGIDVDCLPVLDVPVPGAHDVIGDRAYGLTPEPITALGRAAAEGALAGGVLPIIKHIPGHGRAGVDSHLELPRVDTPADELSRTDFKPFKALADLPLAMSAHVIYGALDPDAPATTSPRMIADIIRGEIGFDGCLMSDDLSMEALSGTLAERTKASIAAGCDLVLHCNGKMVEMEAVASEAPRLSAQALTRADAALGMRKPAEKLDLDAALAEFEALLAI